MENLNIKNSSIKTFFLAFVLMAGSCKKGNSCYDEQLYQQHKDDMCTADCPKVKGCDGKTYCNACVAQRQGIRVK